MGDNAKLPLAGVGWEAEIRCNEMLILVGIQETCPAMKQNCHGFFLPFG